MEGEDSKGKASRTCDVVSRDAVLEVLCGADLYKRLSGSIFFTSFEKEC